MKTFTSIVNEHADRLRFEEEQAQRMAYEAKAAEKHRRAAVNAAWCKRVERLLLIFCGTAIATGALYVGQENWFGAAFAITCAAASWVAARNM